MTTTPNMTVASLMRHCGIDPAAKGKGERHMKKVLTSVHCAMEMGDDPIPHLDAELKHILRKDYRVTLETLKGYLSDGVHAKAVRRAYIVKMDRLRSKYAREAAA